MRIGAEYFALAAKIQEAALAMCHEDIRTRVSDALRAAFKDSERWAYVQAIFGDDTAGDVVYSCNGDLKKAPYTISGGSAKIDTAAAYDVAPLTTYERETVSATEAGARNSKRDAAQLQAIHDAAMKLGATCAVKESKTDPPVPADLKLSESAVSFVGFSLREAATKDRTSYPVKLIDPGTGSSAHYPAAVLKKAAEAGTFKAGTLMFWNHPTAIEEASRPEGDLNNLAAILTSPGVWKDNGPKGPGVYGEAKVMADYSTKVAERAPHIGLSIRAGGKGSGRLVDGKPELASIDYVESVDYVTRAGRGGLALAEAARDAGILDDSQILNEGATEMDATEIKKLQESLAAQTAINQGLLRRALRADAIELGTAVLATTSLTEAQRRFVIDMTVGHAAAPRDIPVTEAGAIDPVKLTESFNAHAKAYAATLPNPGVSGMGPGAGPRLVETAEQVAARESRQKNELAQDFETLVELGLDEAAAKRTLGIRAA
jgi:hypothetical protein